MSPDISLPLPYTVEHQRVPIQSYNLNGLAKNSLTFCVLISKAEPSAWKKLKHHHTTVPQGGFSSEFHMEWIRFRTLPLKSNLFDPNHLKKLPVNSRKTNKTFLTMHSFCQSFRFSQNRNTNTYYYRSESKLPTPWEFKLVPIGKKKFHKGFVLTADKWKLYHTSSSSSPLNRVNGGFTHEGAYKSLVFQ